MKARLQDLVEIPEELVLATADLENVVKEFAHDVRFSACARFAALAILQQVIAIYKAEVHLQSTQELGQQSQ